MYSLSPHVAGRSLGSCCIRLNEIYRTSVRQLSLTRVYGEEDCAKIRQRFPCICSFEFDFKKCFFTSPHLISGTYPNYPNCMLQSVQAVDKIALLNAAMHAREVQAMVENCSGMKTFELCRFSVVLDHNAMEVPGEGSTLSLELHATTLEELIVTESAIKFSPHPCLISRRKECAVDLRWLNFPRLFALKTLSLASLGFSNGSLSQLATLTSLESLSLCRLSVHDRDMVSFLPSLSKLRSLRLSGCQELSSRVLQCLPLELKYLDISGTAILGIPPGAARTENESSKTARSIKTVVAENMTNPRFDFLLKNVAGASIERLYLGGSKPRRSTSVLSTELVYMLTKTPNLLNLSLESVGGLDESVCLSISQLSCLRKLDVSRTDVSDACLVILGSGPCRHSLRRIQLAWCPRIEDTKGARLLLSSRFGRCDFVWNHV